ncbi:MAG: vitamin K epoxide reductase family protein [Phycisphaera sp. RhM]|nr:vitamin K epoxide reductase family protein [Phycisphaera sp. RhM]
MKMGSRGVSRPMAESKMREEKNDDRCAGGSHQHHMTDDDRLSMLEMHHKQTLWIYWTLPLLGVWLMTAPFNFGYLNESLWVDPSGGRGPWFAEESTPELREFRAWLMTFSDVISGALLLSFGYRTLKPNRPYSLWACCFVGVWLTVAPIAFWAPTAAAYANDSLIGILVMALTILIPGMPNMIMFMQHGPAQPPGWSYNPSSWPQRWIMIVTGFLGFIVSRYLAMFQLGYIDYVWDPFFGFANNTEKVLNSTMSHMWPVSDGGLGAMSYTFEFMMGYMGSPSRWRTMPWMVAFFGVLVIPLGLTHIFLVISQPVIVHAWCAMCLLAALIMLPMIPLEVDEVIAMFQHVRQAKQRGDRGGSVWAIFWKGGKADGCTADERSPAMIEFPDKPVHVFKASLWGMSFPWTLVACSALGVVTMFLPTWFGIDIKTTAADIGHLIGALIVTVSVVCMGEVIRLGRYLNVALAMALAVGPWLLGDTSTGYAMTATIVGIGVAVLSIPRGRIEQTYGSWDQFIR